MLPDRVSNPGPLTYDSGALPIALRSPAYQGGESCGLNDRAHRISYRYSDKTCKNINKLYFH